MNSRGGPWHAWYSEKSQCAGSKAILYRREDGEDVWITSVQAVAREDPLGELGWDDVRYCGIVYYWVSSSMEHPGVVIADSQFRDSEDPRKQKSNDVCSECKGTGQYVGAFVVEPCRVCQ